MLLEDEKSYAIMQNEGDKISQHSGKSGNSFKQNKGFGQLARNN